MTLILLGLILIVLLFAAYKLHALGSIFTEAVVLLAAFKEHLAKLLNKNSQP